MKKKNPPKAPHNPSSLAAEERTANLETEPAVVFAFIQFVVEFEKKILAFCRPPNALEIR
jgi:hypothetical protein